MFVKLKEVEQKSQIDLIANVAIGVIDVQKNRIIDEIFASNLVTLSGRNLTRDLLIGNTSNFISHVGVGTNNTAVLSSDTALGTEVYRGAITKQTTTDGVFNIFFYLGSTAANGNTLVETAMFNAASAGTLFARVLHSSISKTASIAISYNWQINIAAS